MKKSTKIFKRFIALFLCVLMSIESFAAVVSDNDGSAFVTKAEFEALKNNFSSQIDNYNTSIDSKIDGAIAAYLAGSELSREPDNLWVKIMNSSANNFKWCSGPLPSSTNRGSGTNDLKDNITVTSLRYHNHPEWKVFGTVRSHGDKGTHDSPGVIYAVSWRSASESSYHVDSPANIERAYTNGAGSNLKDLTAWTNQYDFTTRKNSYARNNDLNDSWVTVKYLSEGNGKLFELNRLPNDNFELKSYNSTAYVDDRINLIRYSYKNFRSPTNISGFNSYYTVAHGMDDWVPGGWTSIQTHNVTFEKGSGWTGSKIGDSTTIDYTSSSNWTYGTQTLSWVTESDGKDYSYMYWGTNVNQSLYAINDQVVPDWNTASEKTGYANGTAASNYYTYQRDFYEYTGPNNEDVRIGNIQFKFYHPTVNPKNFTLKQLQNSYASKIASDTLFHGNGAPLMRIYDKDATYKLKDIKLELYDANNNLTSGSVKLMISNNKFTDGNYANESNDKCFETTVSIGSTGKLTFDSGNFLVGNVDTIWINIYPTDTTNFKTVKLVSVNPVIA